MSCLPTNGFFKYNFFLFIYVWLCRVLFALRAVLWLQRAEAPLWLWCTGFPLQWLPLRQSMGSRVRGLPTAAASLAAQHRV